LSLELIVQRKKKSLQSDFCRPRTNIVCVVLLNGKTPVQKGRFCRYDVEHWCFVTFDPQK